LGERKKERKKERKTKKKKRKKGKNGIVYEKKEGKGTTIHPFNHTKNREKLHQVYFFFSFFFVE
jgi:hypothetical protein